MKNQDDVPLYNSRITNSYIEYLQHHYPHINIDNILHNSDMKRYEVEDPGHWFTQKQVDCFHEQVVEESNNPNLPREVGRFIASSDSAGAVKQYGLGLLNPMSVYLMVETFYRIMTKGASAIAKKLGPSKVEITVTPQKVVNEKPYQCLNRKGTFESLAKPFTGKYANIRETQCYHKGDKHCRYVIDWENTPALFLKLIRNYMFLGITFTTPILFFLLSFNAWFVLVLGLISTTLFLSAYSDRLEKRELYNTIKAQGNAAKDLVDEIEVRHNNALLVQEIGQVTSSIVDTDQMIIDVLNIIIQHLTYDRGMILMPDNASNILSFLMGVGFDDQIEEKLQSKLSRLDNNASTSVISEAFKTQQPYLYNKIDTLGEDDSKNVDIFRQIGTIAFICVPIVYEKRSLGLLVMEHIHEKRMLTKNDLSLLIGIASQIAVGINNAKSFQTLQSIKEELQRSHDDLENRVEERTSELEKLNRELSSEIEERLKSENKLRTTIKEKDTLFKEVHHRVKNNMQVISSLLDMSISRAKHPETKDLLSEAQAKIFTMSMIHSQLYQSGRFDEINIGRFIRDFTNQLSIFYGADSNIILSIKAADINMSVTQAIPCALGVNEILSNAYKHAFEGISSPRISILLESKDLQTLHLNIRDNGVGIPDYVNIDTTETLGIKLIRNLITIQLKGELNIDNKNGTEIDMEFPLIKS